ASEHGDERQTGQWRVINDGPTILALLAEIDGECRVVLEAHICFSDATAVERIVSCRRTTSRPPRLSVPTPDAKRCRLIRAGSLRRTAHRRTAFQPTVGWAEASPTPRPSTAASSTDSGARA